MTAAPVVAGLGDVGPPPVRPPPSGEDFLVDGGEQRRWEMRRAALEECRAELQLAARDLAELERYRRSGAVLRATIAQRALLRPVSMHGVLSTAQSGSNWTWPAAAAMSPAWAPASASASSSMRAAATVEPVIPSAKTSTSLALVLDDDPSEERSARTAPSELQAQSSEVSELRRSLAEAHACLEAARRSESSAQRRFHEEKACAEQLSAELATSRGRRTPSFPSSPTHRVDISGILSGDAAATAAEILSGDAAATAADAEEEQDATATPSFAQVVRSNVRNSIVEVCRSGSLDAVLHDMRCQLPSDSEDASLQDTASYTTGFFGASDDPSIRLDVMDDASGLPDSPAYAPSPQFGEPTMPSPAAFPQGVEPSADGTSATSVAADLESCKVVASKAPDGSTRGRRVSFAEGALLAMEFPAAEHPKPSRPQPSEVWSPESYRHDSDSRAPPPRASSDGLQQVFSFGIDSEVGAVERQGVEELASPTFVVEEREQDPGADDKAGSDDEFF